MEQRKYPQYCTTWTKKGSLERLCCTVEGRPGTELYIMKMVVIASPLIISFGSSATIEENGVLLLAEMFKNGLYELVKYCCSTVKLKEMVCRQEFFFSNKSFDPGWCWNQLSMLGTDVLTSTQ